MVVEKDWWKVPLMVDLWAALTVVQKVCSRAARLAAYLGQLMASQKAGYSAEAMVEWLEIYLVVMSVAVMVEKKAGSLEHP